MDNVKKANDFRVVVRLQGLDAGLAKDLMKVAGTTGMNVSRVAAMAIRVGLPFVKESLEGLPIDLDSAAWSLTSEGESRRRGLEG